MSSSESETSSHNENPTAPTNLNASASAAPHTPAAIALHQALHVSSIKNHVPVELSLDPPNYTSWRRLFTVHLAKFNLLSHIRDPSPSTNGYWELLDNAIVSWIYASISPDILLLVLDEETTAFHLWETLDNLFRDNKRARAIQLESEFRGLRQGTLSITEYCMRMKSLSNALADVGNPISDENLVLQTIGGLNESFATIRSVIQFQTPFPSFHEARSRLILEEQSRIHMAPPATALAVHNDPPAPPPAVAGSSSGSSSGGNTNYNPNRGRGKGRGKGRYKQNNGRGFIPPQLWQLLQAYQPWPANSASGSPSPGILGARPQQPQQAFYSTAQTPSWDQNSLVSALNAMSIQQQQRPQDQWFMDTGASSHMSNNPGSHQQDGDPALQ